MDARRQSASIYIVAVTHVAAVAFAVAQRGSFWESAGLVENMLEGTFELDPPCASRSLVQISRNPVVCYSNTSCSSRGFGAPCSQCSRGAFWKFASLSGTVKRGQCLPNGAQRHPDRETAANEAQDSHLHPAEQLVLLGRLLEGSVSKNPRGDAIGSRAAPA